MARGGKAGTQGIKRKKQDENAGEDNESELLSDTETEKDEPCTSESNPVPKKKKKETTTTELMNFLKAMDTKFDTKFDKTNEKVDSVLNSVKSLEERIAKVESTVSESETKHSTQFNALSKEMEQIQIDFRKLYLIFVGLKEDAGETERVILNKINDFCKVELEVGEVQLDTAYRFGDNRFGPRHIKVKFLSLRQRNEVFSSRNRLRTKKIPVYINEDLPPQTTNRRKLLRKECTEAKDSGHKTRLLGDKLWIDDIPYEMDDKNTLVRAKSIVYKKNQRPVQTNSKYASHYPGTSRISYNTHGTMEKQVEPGFQNMEVSETPGTSSIPVPFQQRPLVQRSPPRNCGNCGLCTNCAQKTPE